VDIDAFVQASDRTSSVTSRSFCGVTLPDLLQRRPEIVENDRQKDKARNHDFAVVHPEKVKLKEVVHKAKQGGN
jgi:hypothetical protein